MDDAAPSSVVRFRSPRRKPLPIPRDAVTALATLGFPGVDGKGRATYRLRRSKRGTEILVTIGVFTWNLSYSQGCYPESFSAAREYMTSFSDRYGTEISEDASRRAAQPKGTDRALVRAGGCLEAWLRSDVPALWAEAMVRCRHPGRFCGSDGYCHNGQCDMEMDP